MLIDVFFIDVLIFFLQELIFLNLNYNNFNALFVFLIKIISGEDDAIAFTLIIFVVHFQLCTMLKALF
jgi:hypothetical protein